MFFLIQDCIRYHEYTKDHIYPLGNIYAQWIYGTVSITLNFDRGTL